MQTHEYRHLIDELLEQRRSSGEELADAAAEFKQASQRYVAAYDKALKAGWNPRQLRGFPDPAKPVRATRGKKATRRPANAPEHQDIQGGEDNN